MRGRLRNEALVTLSASRNSPTFFFGQTGTLAALESLSGASHLVLYCGAGVSIDQTSVTWSQLVSGVFQIAKATRLGGRSTEAKSVEYLLEKLGDDRQAASILVEEFKDSAESENAFLGTKLKEVLYRKQGWQRGYIMRNLVQLSLAAARHDRNVTIITTNYDTYIEDEFVERREKLVAAGLPADEAAGLNRRVLDGPGLGRIVQVVAPGTNAATVEIVYLHGRVDHVGGVEGDIVLTEQSYAQSRERSSEILRENFSGDDKGVLIVGASLTDEPLIHALALTKPNIVKRFALITAPRQLSDPLEEFDSSDPGTVINAAAVRTAWQRRASHLGVKQLSPISHSQSAQFLEELRVCLTAAELTKNVKQYGRPSAQIGYPQRLMLWHTGWNKRNNDRRATQAHKKLKETLAVIQVLLKENATAGETLRLEVWARRDPSTANRRLTLWANSTGPLLEESTMRSEAIEGLSRNASVRAMLAGRPLLTELKDMGFPANASRWQTFLSVPVFYQVPTTVNGAADSAYVPVGVVTLASDRSLGTGATASILSDSLPIETFTKLKVQLIAIGREVLSM